MSTNTLYELRCRECGKTWGNIPRSFCEDCFSPLEVAYDYEALKKTVRREDLAARDFNMWRYAELLPLPEGYTGPNAVGGAMPSFFPFPKATPVQTPSAARRW